MNNDNNKQFSLRNNSDKILFAIILGLTYILLFRSPYRLDDWTWGSSVGWDYLVTDHFSCYNGRYFSDILVLILMRLPVLIRALFQLIVLVGIGFYTFRILKDKNNLCIFTLLFLFIPLEVFSQTIAWVSGFSNYSISALFVLFHYDNCVNVLLKDKDQNRIRMTLLCPIIIISQLILETTTIYLIFLYISTSVLFYVRYNRISIGSIIYSSSAVLGAIIMFSNEAYRLSSDGIHGRHMFFSDNLSDNLIIYWDRFRTVIVSTWMINLFIPMSLVLIIFSLLLINKTKVFSIVASILFFVSFMTYQMIGILGGNSDTQRDIFSVLCLLFLVYIIYVISVSTIPIVDKQVIILCALSQILLVGPLIPVQPTMERCFLQPYIHGTVLTCYLFAQISNTDCFKSFINNKITFRLPKLSIVTSLSVIGYLLFWLYMQNEACSIYKLRLEAIKEIKQNNESILIQPCVPYSNIFYFGSNLNDYSEDWQVDYKCFYGIPDEVNIVFVEFEQFNEMEDNYAT